MNSLAVITNGYISIAGTVTVEQISTGILELELPKNNILEQVNIVLELPKDKVLEQSSETIETEDNIDLDV